MIEILLLGQFDVRLDGEPVEIPSRPAQSLLAYLVLNAGTAHRREKLAGLLWPDSEEANARSNLRHALWRLRKVIGDEFFQSDKVSITFVSSSDYISDVAILNDEDGLMVSCDDLIRNVSVYEGELLPGFYDEWITLEREHLYAVFENRVQILLDRLIEEGRWREACEWGERWIALGQSPEPAYRALMTARAGMDDLSGVANAYQRCVEVLSEELGVEPSEETRNLFQRLTHGEKPLEKLAEKPLHNLPAQPTPFIGREEELALIAERLADPTCRLLTLFGAGGIGKTRLALQLAAGQVGIYPHGIFFIPLAPVNSPDFMVSAIAEAIRFHLSGAEDPRMQLVNYLRKKVMLLVMDNFEHLLEGVELLAEILSYASSVKMLVTSRERLNLHGEWVFEVYGMPIPRLEEFEHITKFSVVQLFQQSAERIQNGFSLSEADAPHLIRICQLVGGLPLGVEMAAAWVRMLSCEEIADEIGKGFDFLESPLRDMPERHRSLRAVFSSSWQLLSEEEKQVVQRLSIFRGHFTRRAAMQVAKASLSTLSSLANKSYLRVVSDGRYEIHNLLQQYTYNKLCESEEEKQQTANLHCETYVDLISHWEDGLRGGKRREAVSAIGFEIDNVRAAWDWALEMRRMDQLQKSLESLWLFYDIRSWFKEGYETFGRAIDSLRKDKDARLDRDTCIVLAQLLARQAWFAWRFGGYQDAMSLVQESLAIAREMQFPSETAFCLNLLGTLAYAQGSYSEAKELCQESLSLWRELVNQWGTAISLFNLGQVAHALGEYGEAEQPYREGLEIFREIGYQYGATFSFDSLGRVARTLGDFIEAKELCLESLALRRELDDQWGVAACLDSLGAVMFGLGEYRETREICLESLEIKKALGDQRGIATSLNNLSQVVYFLGDYRQARNYCEESLAIRRELGDRRGIAASLNMLGDIAIMLEIYPAAKHYCHESLVIRRELGDRRGIAAVLNTLGLIALALEDHQEAERYFREALGIAVKIGVLPLCLEVLVGLAECFVEDGRVKLASELLALVTIHPSSAEDIKEKASVLLNKVLSDHPSDEISQARDRGTTKTLFALIADILEERT